MEFIADYSRQLLLDSMSESKQAAIMQSSVLIFGAGGLGVTAISYLAGAGVGAITIVDFDRIEASNLHRQTIYRASDIGQFKAQVAASYIGERSPNCDIVALTQVMDLPRLYRLCEQHDVILDCTDDQPFSYLLNSICLVAAKKAVCANAAKLEGQLFILNPDIDQPCFNCLWPEDPLSLNQTCNQIGVLGPVPGILGCLQALETIKILTDQYSHLSGHLLYCDFTTYDFLKLKVPKSESCNHRRVYSDLERTFAIYRSTIIPRVHELILDGNILIDIRSIDEVNQQSSGFSARHIEAQELVANPEIFLDKKEQYLLICSSGKRSKAVCDNLQQRGYRAAPCRLGTD